MRQQLRDLYEIQRIDLEIRDLEKEHELVPAKLREMDSNLQSLSSKILTITGQRDELIRELKGLEGIVKAENHKIKKWEARLNEIRNQREYLALSREIEGSKRQNRECEEKIKELTAKREQIEAQLHEAQAKMSADQQDRDSEITRVDEQSTGLRDHVAQGKGRREALLHKVPAQLIRKYDAIRAKRMGLGLVPVTEGSCTGCNMKLPPQLYNILQRGNSIEQCPSCVRLIVWDQFIADDTSDKQEQAVASNDG